MPIIQLDIDASGSVRGIRQYAQATQQGAAATNLLAGSAARAESGLGGLAKKALAVGTAYLTVAGGIEQVSKATKLFVGFDDALRVASSYAGVLDETSQEFSAMATAAKEAGATTSASTTTAAQALGELTSRGLSAQQAISALTPTIRLAEAAQADLGKAAAVSSGIMAGLGKDVSYLSRINDIIVGISGASALNLDAVGAAATYAVPAARAAGEELESMMSVIGVLVDQQFEAGQSGNAYKNMLISLIKPSTEAATELARMGVSVKDSKGNFVGLLPVLDQLKTRNLNLQQSTAIFGREWATAALAATNSISEIRKDTNYLKNDIDGITQTASKFQQGGLGGAFRELESAVEAVYIAVGEQLAPVFKEVTGDLTKYASNTSAVVTASGLAIDAFALMTNGLLAVHITAAGATDGLSGLVAFGANFSPIYRGIELIADGLELIGAIDSNPLEAWRKDLNAFAKEQDGAAGRAQAFAEKVNDKLAEYRKLVDDANASRERSVQHEKALATAAEAAGIAAGKAAASQGKSFAEAVAAAEAGKKSYLEQAKAAEQKQAADVKSTASAATAKTALEEQAAAIKQQAISYGYTAEQAQAAANEVLATGKAADGVSSAGVDSVAAGLNRVKEKAQEASTALSGIGGGAAPEAPTGGIVSFAADLDLSPYQNKVALLKTDIDNFKTNYHTFQLKFDGPPEFAEARNQLGELETAYSKAQAALQEQQPLDNLNQKLKETRSELSQTRQTFADGKLVIDTDPAATAALQGQVQALNDAKLAAGAMGAGFEYVNGVLTNISPAASAAKAAYDGLADSSGNIVTEWRQIDGVWEKVLPNGEKLVDALNKKMLEGVTAAGELGGAVAAAAGQIASGSAEADKIIASLTGSVEKAAAKAGTLKFDELKNSTTALSVVRAQIKSLEGDIETFGITSEKGQAAVAGILELEAVEAGAQAKIKALHEEIYGTGEEAKKTAAAVSEIPSAASTAAAAVSDLTAATKELAESKEGIKEAVNTLQEFGKIQTGVFSFSRGKSLEEMTQAELEKYTESQRQIADALKSQADRSKNEVWLTTDQTSLTKRNQIVDSGYGSYFEAQAERLKRAVSDFTDGAEESIRITRRGTAATVAVGTEGVGRAETTAEPSAVYNFYGYDRSDAADIVNRSKRVARRA
jgi:TP901 family phage tail tape measure protein